MPLQIVTIFSPITPKGTVDDILSIFRDSDATTLSPDDYPEKTLYRPFVFIGSGGTENLARDFLLSRNIEGTVTLLAHDRSNSLPAAMEIRAFLEGRDIPARIVHANLSDLHSMIQDWVHFQEALEEIAQSRVALIGEPSFWLIASAIDHEQVKKRWGLAIEQYPIQEVVGKLGEKLGSEQQSNLANLKDEAKCTDVTDEELDKAALVTERVTEFVREHSVQGVTLECFKLLEDTNISGCYALSNVNDLEGVVAGCEGDIASTFTLLVAKLLTGQASFMANVTEVNHRENSVVLAHCTVPRSMTTSHEITTHFETDLSVALRGKLEEGPITVFKIGGEGLDKYWVSGGRIVENLRNETGCRTQVRVILDAPVSYFLEESLANHHILLAGDHSELIDRFLQFAIQ